MTPDDRIHTADPGDTADLSEVATALEEGVTDAVPSLAETPQPQAEPAGETEQEPVNAPGLETVPVEGRAGADKSTGSSKRLSWGARTDVGLIRDHNEDSFLVQAPLFAVCDGMGGHAAGEVASSIAVQSIAREAPEHAEDAFLGAAIERANDDIMSAVAAGTGKAGMGCTATAVIIEDARMAVAHVGDSRVYVLHQGSLVRVTHDHSFVEELVDAGEITADEARIHPSRSVITRALGSDPEMYADHFTLDVEKGDRIIICSDGLSSMASDSLIESVAVSSASPQQAADNLVSCALSEGGHDNVTVVVVDVLDDGKAELRRKAIMRSVGRWFALAAICLALLAASVMLFIRSSWYIANDNGNVAIYHGVDASIFGHSLSELEDRTSIKVSDLPEAVQKQLDEGIRISSYQEAVDTVDSYRSQIDEEKTRAAEAADAAQSQAEAGEDGEPLTLEGVADPDQASENPEDAPDNGEAEKGGEG